MNNSSFLEQLTNLSNPYQPPKVEPEEKLIGGPLYIIEKQENKKLIKLANNTKKKKWQITQHRKKKQK